MGQGTSDNKKIIFISHFHEEESIAIAIKDVLVELVGDKAHIFLSKTILFGEDWNTSVNQHLKSANLLLLLFSPESVERPWINIEAGYGIIDGKNVIPMYCLGLDQEKLHYAYQRLKGVDITSKNDIRRLLGENIMKGLLGLQSFDLMESFIEKWQKAVFESIRSYMNEQTVKYHLEAQEYFVILNDEKKRCLDIFDFNIEENAEVIGYAAHSGRNQLWMLQRVEQKYFKIVSKLNNLCLSVVKSNSKNEAAVEQSTDKVEEKTLKNWNVQQFNKDPMLKTLKTTNISNG